MPTAVAVGCCQHMLTCHLLDDAAHNIHGRAIIKGRAGLGEEWHLSKSLDHLPERTMFQTQPPMPIHLVKSESASWILSDKEADLQLPMPLHFCGFAEVLVLKPGEEQGLSTSDILPCHYDQSFQAEECTDKK